MRYAAVLTERLWSLVEYEQAKVRIISLAMVEELADGFLVDCPTGTRDICDAGSGSHAEGFVPGGTRRAPRSDPQPGALIQY
jgi:hypothetical protein